MNAFDYTIISWLTSLEGRHPAFDKIFVNLSAASGFLKCGPIVALYWWAWFKNGEGGDKNKNFRELVVAGMLACVVSLVIARLAVLMFPFRIRPVADPTNGFHFPQEAMVTWRDWSSFPSDHAIMFATLTTCLFFVARSMGYFALLYSLFVVCLPRVYLGIHYPTDILAGAAIGVGVGLAATQKRVKQFTSNIVLGWAEEHSGLFYSLSFLFMFQVTTAFSDVLSVFFSVARHVSHLLRQIF